MSTMHNIHHIIKLSKQNIFSWWLWYDSIIWFSILKYVICSIYYLFCLLPQSLYYKPLSFFHIENIFETILIKFVNVFVCFFSKNHLHHSPPKTIWIGKWIISIMHTLLHRNIVTKFVAHLIHRWVLSFQRKTLETRHVSNCSVQCSSFMTQLCFTNVLSSDKGYKLDVFCWLLHSSIKDINLYDKPM